MLWWMSLCPICARFCAGAGAPRTESGAAPSHLPFCSARCKQIDLGKWLSEDYRVSAPLEPDSYDESLLTPSHEDNS
jgi:endogenous inhibitor of DNA gyrase (YacG/DUF329 family)